MDQKNDSEAWQDTFAEILILFIIISSFGTFLFFKFKKDDTSASYIHKFFKPIDDFLMTNE